MNLGSMMKMQNALKTFQAEHPKVMPFIKAVEERGLHEGMILEITVQTADGERMTSNIKVKQSDLELLQMMKEMRQQ